MNESIEELLASGAIVPDRPGSKRLVPAAQSVVVPLEDWRHVVGALKNAKARLPMGAAIGNVSDALSKVEHLRPAPAPSTLAGGEVEKALDDALIYIEQLGENIERNDVDMHLDTIERPFSFAQNMRGRFPSLCAALSPEAPVREGLDVLRDWKDPASPSVNGPVAWRWRRPGGVWNYQEDRQVIPGTVCEPLYDHALPPRHEAPADPCASHRSMGFHIDPCCPHCEAPAEGAGERDYPAEFEAWWMTYRNANREKADYNVKKQIAFDAFYHGARSSAPEAREEALGNLLAVIHGDGGHRALEVGTQQAALEAEKIVAGLFAAPSADKLREFGQHTNLELSYHYSEEGDSDGWQVHRVNGGVNDREWDLIGSGATRADAIDQALAALKAECA